MRNGCSTLDRRPTLTDPCLRNNSPSILHCSIVYSLPHFMATCQSSQCLPPSTQLFQLLDAGIARIRIDRLFLAVQYLLGLCHLPGVRRRAHHRVYQTALGVAAYVRVDPEEPLVFFRRLMQRRVASLRCASFLAHASAVNIVASVTAPSPLIRQTLLLLHQITPEHPLQTRRRKASLACQVARLNDPQRFRPRHHLLHFGQATRSPRRPLLAPKIRLGQAHFLYFATHCIDGIIRCGCEANKSASITTTHTLYQYGKPRF